MVYEHHVFIGYVQVSVCMLRSQTQAFMFAKQTLGVPSHFLSPYILNLAQMCNY